MNKLKREYERELQVAEKRKEYELQAVLNQYDCMRQRIDLEYQSAIREIRDEVLMTRRKRPVPPPTMLLHPEKRKSRDETLFENAGEEDLKEINRLIHEQHQQAQQQQQPQPQSRNVTQSLTN